MDALTFHLKQQISACEWLESIILEELHVASGAWMTVGYAVLIDQTAVTVL